MLNKTTLFATSAVLAIAVSTPAFAQVDEVITTATKRQTTLQDTPVTVSVTSADVIQKARIEDLGDLQSVTPTLRVSQLQNSGNTSFSLRGFGNGTNNVGLEPSIGVFIDGVYRSRAAASINNLPNLERVEILPGPQSTLFGKNASGGVISIITAKPSFETSGYVQGGIGNNSLRQAKGYITGGVAENVAISLGGNIEAAEGYFSTEGAKDNNEIDRAGVRGQILYEPTDNVTLRLIADGSTIDENCCGTSLAIIGPVSVQNQAAGFLPSGTDPYAYTSNANQDANNEITDNGVSLHVDVDYENFTLTSISALRNNEWFYDSDSDFSSRDILRDVFQSVDTQTLSQELRITSDLDGPLQYMVGGYYFQEDLDLESGAYWGADARSFAAGAAGQGNVAVGDATLNGIGQANGVDGTLFFSPDLGSSEFFEQDDEAFSIFGTVDYELTDRFTVTGGLNYTTVDKQVSSRAEITDPFAFLDFRGEAAENVVSGGIFVNGLANPGFDSTMPVSATNPDFLIQSFFNTFGQAPTPANIGAIATNPATAAGFAAYNAGVTGATASIVASDDNPLLPLTGLQFLVPSVGFPNAVEDGSTSDSKVTWNIRGAYDLNDNINIYASAATGFKSSSWNLTRDTRPTPADKTLLDAQNLSTVNQTVGTRFAGPEESEVFEIGMKARYENLAFNIAAFNQSIEGFQAAIFNGSGFALSNAEKSTTNGIEFDTKYSPNAALDLTFAGTLLDAEYDEFTGAIINDDGTAVDLTGQRPAGVPEVALATSATYSHDFGGDRAGYIRLEHQYESEVALVDNLPDSLTREVNSLNASLGYSFANDVSVQLWGRNILEDEYPTSGFPTPLISSVEQSLGLPANLRSTSIYPNQPRTYGVSLRKDF